MPDLTHTWGEDLKLSPTGNLALSSGSDWGTTAVVRMLMTNPGDDEFNPDFGGGIRAFIGSTASNQQIQASILKSMRSLAAVDQTVPVSVVVVSDAGTRFVKIKYVDSASGQTVALTPIQLGG